MQGGNPLFRRGARRTAVLLTGTLVAGALVAPGSAFAAPNASPLKTAVADDGSRVISEKWLNKREVDLTVASRSVGQKLKVRLLVPKSWKRGAHRSWPTVYMLHGGRDNYVSWTRSTDIAKLADKYGVIVATPECGRSGSNTNWYNYGKWGTPGWETFHMSETRQILERAYHAGPSRAVAGISSGGMGAMYYAGKYTGMFKYAASYSGVLNFSQPGIPVLLRYINSQEPGLDPDAIWGRPILDQANWDAHDPFLMLDRMKKNIQLYVSAGTTSLPGELDKPGTSWSPVQISEAVFGSTTRTYALKARLLGIPITQHIYLNGTHSWPYWKRELHLSWAPMMKAIGAQRLDGKADVTETQPDSLLPGGLPIDNLPIDNPAAGAASDAAANLAQQLLGGAAQ